jgi:hypothetical protein
LRLDLTRPNLGAAGASIADFFDISLNQFHTTNCATQQQQLSCPNIATTTHCQFHFVQSSPQDDQQVVSHFLLRLIFDSLIEKADLRMDPVRIICVAVQKGSQKKLQ